MNIDNLTYKNLKEISNLLVTSTTTSAKKHPYEVGKKYLIRTVTMTICGELKNVFESELVFTKASWIADTGRFHDSLKSCNFDEVEPFVNDVIVGRGSLIDCTELN